MEAGRCKCLWFQSFFVIWRQQQGWNWRESPTHAKILSPMDTGAERELSTNWPDPLEGSFCHLLSFLPHHLVIVKVIRPLAFVELKSPNPPWKGESISLGADGVRQRGFWIIIRTWFQSPTTLVYPLVSSHTQLTRRMEAGRCECLWFQSFFIGSILCRKNNIWVKMNCFALLFVSVSWAPPYPNFPKFDPHLHRYNSVRVHPYAHPKHMKFLKHFIYIQYGCGMQSVVLQSWQHNVIWASGFNLLQLSKICPPPSQE